MSLANLKRLLVVAILSCIATSVFAEDAAPVYDVDNYPPQFDGSSDAGVAGAGAAQPPSDASQPDLQPGVQTSSQQQEVAPPAADQPVVVPHTSLTMEQRMRRVEQQINNAQQSTSSTKVDALQNQVQSLRGQVEELTHQLQQVQNQQRAMFTDLDKKTTKSPVNETTVASAETSATSSIAPVALDQPVSKVEKKSTAVVKSPSTSSSAVPLEKPVATASKSVTDNQPNVAEEQQIYQTAYDLIKAKKYNEAVTALQKMLQKYPTGQFAANAHYWLGELYGLLNKNDLSAKEFSTVVSDYPDSPKVADAQLKVGLIYAGQFKWNEAKTIFKKVVSRYPGTSSARLASEQLKQIKQAGH